jgi:hypothetical protein
MHTQVDELLFTRSLHGGLETDYKYFEAKWLVYLPPTVTLRNSISSHTLCVYFFLYDSFGKWRLFPRMAFSDWSSQWKHTVIPRQTFENRAATCVTTAWDAHTMPTYLVINCLVYNVMGRVYLFVIGTQILKPSHSPPTPFQSFQQQRMRAWDGNFPVFAAKRKKTTWKFDIEKLAVALSFEKKMPLRFFFPPVGSCFQSTNQS